MSRRIVNDHPWDDDEVAYQLSRGRRKEVEKNRKDFPPGSKPKAKPQEPEGHSEQLELDEDVFNFVDTADDETLNRELDKRNLLTSGTEIERKVRLAKVLQEEKDANRS